MQNGTNSNTMVNHSKRPLKPRSLRRKNTEGRRDVWLIKQLDQYEINFSQSDIDEIKKRVFLVQENIVPIQRLLLRYPDRWPKIHNTLEIFREKAKTDWEKRKDGMDYHSISDKEREYLKKSLMQTNLKLSRLKVPLPSHIFNAIYRFIENKDYEYLLDKRSISYLLTLTEKEDPPPNWDKKLYGFLRKYLRKEIMR